MSLTDQLPHLDCVRVEEVEPEVLLVTLDRPDRLNAITPKLIEEVTSVVDAVDLDRATRAVVLTGAGRGFCAGLDLQGSDSVPPGAEGTGPIASGFMGQDHIATLNERIHRSRKPWIAAVNGPCVGGGFAMALSCDIRIAAEPATFGAVFIKIGVSNCDMGTSYLLPRLVGASRSAELLLTGRIFDADEALRIGLVADVVAPGDLLERCLETARLIAQNPPFGTWMTKETMWQTIDAPSLRHAMDMENRTQVLCSATGEIREAMAAFVEKRPPVWRGL
jgi:enoyl-CoA hydratase/carnithine racemase